MRIYKRIVRVVIGEEEGSALSIDSLYIQIEVKKDLSGKPNEGEVRIYNLAQSTEDRIREKGVRIRIFAGYDNQPILIHDGDIRRVDRSRTNVDRITIITIGGNVIKLSQATFNQSYSGQIQVKQIVIDSIPAFQMDAVNLDQIPEDAFLYDFSLTKSISYF